MYQSQFEQEKVTVDDNLVKAELLNLELAVEQENNFRESNQIHQSAWNPNWIRQELVHLRPFIRSTIKLFELDKKASSPEVLLEEVLLWTGAQAFLTQKLCQLLCESEVFIAAGDEAVKVQQIVQTQLISNWETQAAAEQLLVIRDGLLKNPHCEPISLLRLYQQILQQGEVTSHDSLIQAELLDIGLVVQREGKLRIFNRIYQSVFNLNWVNQEIVRLQQFNHSIIKLFKLDEKANYPDILLEEVLLWTGSHPFLTQKLCQLLRESDIFIAAGEEAVNVQQLVQTQLISNWETQVAAEHLQGIRDDLLKNPHCEPISLLRLYQQILRQGEVPTHDSSAQAELLNIGLVVQHEGKLRISNRIYQSVFNLNWVDQELARLQLLNRGIIKLFKLNDKAAYPDLVLEEVLLWTGAQPFLTKKVCQLFHEFEVFIAAGEEVAKVRQLVQTHLISNWEKQAAAEHLQGIRDGLLKNPHCEPISLLRLYQQILQQEEVLVDGSQEQAELLNLGLLVTKEGKLRISNRIYKSVFNQNWVEKELAKRIQPSHSKLFKNAGKSQVTEVALSPVQSLLANPKDTILKSIWVLLGITGFGFVGFNVFKALEVQALFYQGNELFNQKEYKKAIVKFDKLLNIDSNYYQAWTNRGYALAGLQEYNKMLESCSTATIIEPKATYAWNCQGEALHNLRQYYEAISSFDTAIALESKSPIYWINKTESLLALQQSDTALITIDEAINLLRKTKPADEQEKSTLTRELSVAYSYKGKVLSQKNEHVKALKAYDQALEYDSKYFVALRGKGIALQGLKRYNEAIALFRGLLKEAQLTDAQKAEVWYYLGMSLCNSSQPKEGLTALEAAIKLKPSYQLAEKANLRCNQ